MPELLKIIDVMLDSFLADELMDDEWRETYYLFNALYLLHELQAPEALDEYRRVLLLDSDSIEFWFDDVLFEEVPEMLARACQTRLRKLLAMLEDPEISLQHQLGASSAISRLVIQAELRPVISAFL